MIVAGALKGRIISARGRSRSARKKLRRFIRAAEKAKRLDEWRRGRAVLGYIEGRSAIELATELDVDRSNVTRWVQWHEAMGVEGLVTGKPPGAAPKLTAQQCENLVELIEQGPTAAGYTSGVWTGPMIGDLIAQRFDVHYHNHHIPRLLHKLGFSVQRPRKRLARADADKQAQWLQVTFPKIKKKPQLAVGW
jgi:transposase